MTDRADELLKRWGMFAAAKETGALGYPGRSAFFRLEATGSSEIAASQPVDALVLMVDRIVAAFKTARPELFYAAVYWYVYAEPAGRIASRVGCCRDTVYARVNAVKAAVAVALEAKPCATVGQ